MRIGIVGSSGFVGSAVLRAVTKSGHETHTIRAPRLNMVLRQRNPSPGLDSTQLATAVEHLKAEFSGLDVVVNCAGVAAASSGSTAELTTANALVPVVIARASRLADVSRFIHVSSAAVQGRAAVLDDSDDFDAFSEYSNSKILGEVFLRQERDDSVVFRPPGVHGPDRTVSRAVTRVASSPYASVAAPGDSPTPQAYIENVASAIAFLAVTGETPPRVVIYPWEGLTTYSFLELLGDRRPNIVPLAIARFIDSAFRRAGRLHPSLAAYSRRLDILWFGQEQARSWLTDAGWTPPIPPSVWLRQLSRAG